MLECFSPEEGRVDLEAPPDLGVESWMTGLPFDLPPAAPIHLHWDPETETDGKRRLSLYDAGPVLMRRDLVAALRECGVDNMETYETVVHSRVDGSECLDYAAVNIIGLVAAADMERSGAHLPEDSDGLIDVDFDGLVIDEAKAAGFLLFRLAECVSGVVVHERVKTHIESRGGFGLSFVPPEEWSG